MSFAVQEQNFASIFEDNMPLSEESNYYILDEQNNVISSSSKEDITKTAAEVFALSENDLDQLYRNKSLITTDDTHPYGLQPLGKSGGHGQLEGHQRNFIGIAFGRARQCQPHDYHYRHCGFPIGLSVGLFSSPPLFQGQSNNLPESCAALRRRI